MMSLIDFWHNIFYQSEKEVITMAILLPQQSFSLQPVVGKSYYENLAGGINAAVTVQNNSAYPVELVLTRVNAPVVTYTIPAFNSLTLSVNRLLVAGLLSTAAGPVFGTIEIATSDF
jgi:hypothetical protein